jgi:hypothetical protein
MSSSSLGKLYFLDADELEENYALIGTSEAPLYGASKPKPQIDKVLRIKYSGKTCFVHLTASAKVQ